MSSSHKLVELSVRFGTLCGNSSIGTATGIYGHVMPAMTRDVADQMDAILGGR